MAVTPRIIIVDLLRKYRDQLTPRTVAYLDQCQEQEYPAGRAKLLLPLLQATLKQTVPGYHAQTSSAGWTSCGPQLAEAEISYAERNDWCPSSTAEALRREVRTTLNPKRLLELIACIWAATDKHSRQPKQAA